MKRLILTMALLAAAGANAAEVSNVDRFMLWNDCQPMSLAVEGLKDEEDAAEIGLTVEAIETNALARLRSARLYDEDATGFLYIQISVLGNVHNINVAFAKPVTDLAASGLSDFYARTWNTGWMGFHAGDRGFILSSLSQRMDNFLNEYLRVNEDACGN